MSEKFEIIGFIGVCLCIAWLIIVGLDAMFELGKMSECDCAIKCNSKGIK